MCSCGKYDVFRLMKQIGGGLYELLWSIFLNHINLYSGAFIYELPMREPTSDAVILQAIAD